MRNAPNVPLVTTVLFLLLACATSALAQDGKPEEPAPDDKDDKDAMTVAQVDEQAITRGDVLRHLKLAHGDSWKRWPASTQAEAIKDAREQLIRLAVLEQHFAREPVDPPVTLADVRKEKVRMMKEMARKGKTLEQALRAGNSHVGYLERSLRCSLALNRQIEARIGEREIRAFFQANPVQFQKQWRVRQILRLTVDRVTRAPLSFEAQQKARALIQQARKEIKPDGSNFVELVAKYSNGPRARHGGVLDWYGASHDNPKPFKDAMMKLERPGEVSGVILTPYGYHILQLINVYEPKLEDARQPCIVYTQQKYMRAMLEAAKITRFDFATGKKLIRKTVAGPNKGRKR